MKVLIATKNQGKIKGAKKALERYFEDNENFESYGTSPSFPVPENLVQEILATNLSEVMNKFFGEDKERHNNGGGIQLLTHNEVSRIDLTEYAFIMALTKYINGEKWR